MLAFVTLYTHHLCIIRLLASLVFPLALDFLSFLIESNQLKRLISNRGEKIVFSNKIKDIGFANTKEIRESFSRKAVDKISVARCQSMPV